MPKRRGMLEHVWIKAGTNGHFPFGTFGFIPDTPANEDAEEDHKGHCYLCNDPECIEWPDVWAYTDGGGDGLRERVTP